MPKKNLAATLPTDVTHALEELGARLHACRIDRNFTVVEMAAKMLCTPNTYRDIELGKPGASLGNVALALWLLGQLDSLSQLAPIPTTLVAGRRSKRRKGSSTSMDPSELDF